MKVHANMESMNEIELLFSVYFPLLRFRTCPTNSHFQDELQVYVALSTDPHFPYLNVQYYQVLP
jgi:hypothetical protein